MGRYTNWVVFLDSEGKTLAINDDHTGIDRTLKDKGFEVIGYPLALKPEDAIDCVLSFRD